MLERMNTSTRFVENEMCLLYPSDAMVVPSISLPKICLPAPKDPNDGHQMLWWFNSLRMQWDNHETTELLPPVFYASVEHVRALRIGPVLSGALRLRGIWKYLVNEVLIEPHDWESNGGRTIRATTPERLKVTILKELGGNGQKDFSESFGSELRSTSYRANENRSVHHAINCSHRNVSSVNQILTELVSILERKALGILRINLMSD